MQPTISSRSFFPALLRRLLSVSFIGILLLGLSTTSRALPQDGQQYPLSAPFTNNGPVDDKTGDRGISARLFASLERMARLVDIAYCVGTGGIGISKPFSCASRCKDFPTLHLVRTWNTGILMSDSCGYIAVDHGGSSSSPSHPYAAPAIIVAFRGTYSITNTIVDLSTVPQEYVPYPAPGDGDGDGDGDGGGDGENGCSNCTVHMGFLASWRSAREVVLPVLKEARKRHPRYPIHLVGHSLGGAVAALAALELRLSLGWTEVVVTTFGEPRVGNEALVRYLDAAFGLEGGGGDEDGEAGDKTDRRLGEGENLSYRRVTHVNDPVPLLPLSEWGFRSHAGEVYISKTDLPPEPEDLRLCRGDYDTECSAGAEATGDGGGWLSGLLGKHERKSEGAKGSAEGVVDVYDYNENEDSHEEDAVEKDSTSKRAMVRGFPTRLKLWQLFFAHRDYFWRLGLCVPGGDPADWGRGRYNLSTGSYSWDGDREL